VTGALDARVDQELLPRRTGQRPHHGLNVGLDEIQRDRLIAQGFARRHAAMTGTAATSGVGNLVQGPRLPFDLHLRTLPVYQGIAAALGGGQGQAELTVLG